MGQGFRQEISFLSEMPLGCIQTESAWGMASAADKDAPGRMQTEEQFGNRTGGEWN